ncbi:hypothetical protein SAMN05518849_1183 [Sphingobium sp. AP50]|uniref:catalase family protein n=1 Tax=Sphingobium sp. AP50 TaxID=1884369 RepID=UPI0008D3EEA7|nr:catalase family protein [Sphingobium sp. AP50]SEJ91290.1 hypothetical protein SAMN05518849_1183 [Sphingobium sp. AP50]
MTFVRYRPDIETIAEDEAHTISEIRRVMLDLSALVRAKHGMAMKGTHAKAVGLVKGRLIVERELPVELAQGLFARGSTYEALVRYAPGPPEKLSDKASGQRGMSIKLLGVEGAHVEESDEKSTQDFVLAVDPVFNAADAKSFLKLFRLTGAQSPRVSEGGIIAGSRIARGIEAALEAVGLESANLKFIGRPPRHPVSDPYYSQAPIRYGDYIVKLAVFPSNDTLENAGEQNVDVKDDETFRHVTESYFQTFEAVYDVKVQLCTNLSNMPIEDASVAWSEAESPYRKVATLILPRQQAFSVARQAYFDDRLAFNPAHALEAHRPLGSIMRARMDAYKHTTAYRRDCNNAAPAEPTSLAEVPD